MLAHPSFIVGIGGSAGGLQAYSSLLEALPSQTGMAFVFIAHMSPNGPNLLPDILSRRTVMPVVTAENSQLIQPNHVYVIGPNSDLLIEDFRFKVQFPRTMKDGRHMQIDRFLNSLADFAGPRAIGMILSGGDSDGTDGCIAIKGKGGIVFAQDLSAQVNSMPLHALETGCVDYVLHPQAIAKELVRISEGAKSRDVLHGEAGVIDL